MEEAAQTTFFLHPACERFMIRNETLWKWDLKERRKMEVEQKRDEAEVVTKETCSIIPSKFMPHA